MESNAVTTTNGAGPHNVQLFMLSEDGTVLHCLPGYWDPNDLQSELELAQKLNSLWLDHSITTDQKIAAFKRYQTEHLAGHSPQMQARSHLQGFDAKYIAAHAQLMPECIAQPALLASCVSNCSSGGGGGSGMKESMHVPMEAFKTTDAIMHARMAKYPFVHYENFDTAAYTNYGTHYYDKNENEVAGAVARPELKRLSLHRVTKDAPGAPVEQPEVVAANQRGARGRKGVRKQRTVAPDLFRAFYDLTAQNRYNEAYAYADKLVVTKPTDPAGFEMRAAAAYRLRMYNVAYNDATRAAWLGCRTTANSELRKLSRERITPGRVQSGVTNSDAGVSSRVHY